MSFLKLTVAVLAVCAAAPALAADLPTAPAMTVDPSIPAPDYWKGFYVGTGIDAVVAKGQKGQFGGDVFAGYDHNFDNGLMLGVRFDTGYNPYLSPYGHYHGFDFAETDVKLGYQMGKFTPYVMTGVALARGTNFGNPLPDAGSSINGVFSGPGAVQAVGVAGVGVDYAVTNNLHVGVAAYVNNGGGYLH